MPALVAEMLGALPGEHCGAGNSSRLRDLAPAFLCGHGVTLGQVCVRQSRRMELADRSRTAGLNTSPRTAVPTSQGTPQALHAAATGTSTVSRGTQETSLPLGELVLVPSVTPYPLGGHIWVTHSTQKCDSLSVFTVLVWCEEEEDGARCSDSSHQTSLLASP